MSMCEDFPCCGHEMGCCPDYDESGRQLNMKCTCGATVPLDSRYSICETCLSFDDDNEGFDSYDDEDCDDDGFDVETDGCEQDYSEPYEYEY